jgi:hypothetical protein
MIIFGNLYARMWDTNLLVVFYMHFSSAEPFFLAVRGRFSVTENTYSSLASCKLISKREKYHVSQK